MNRNDFLPFHVLATLLDWTKHPKKQSHSLNRILLSPHSKLIQMSNNVFVSKTVSKINGKYFIHCSKKLPEGKATVEISTVRVLGIQGYTCALLRFRSQYSETSIRRTLSRVPKLMSFII